MPKCGGRLKICMFLYPLHFTHNRTIRSSQCFPAPQKLCQTSILSFVYNTFVHFRFTSLLAFLVSSCIKRGWGTANSLTDAHYAYQVEPLSRFWHLTLDLCCLIYVRIELLNPIGRVNEPLFALSVFRISR